MVILLNAYLVGFYMVKPTPNLLSGKCPKLRTCELQKSSHNLASGKALKCVMLARPICTFGIIDYRVIQKKLYVTAKKYKMLV